MARAQTPEDVGRLIAEAISSRDLDAALALYEPDATFVIPSGFGGGTATGHDALRETFSGLLEMSPQLTVESDTTILAGDTAMVIGNWSVKARDADGNDVQGSGRYTDVLRRQSDGGWLFVIDNPDGTG